RRFSAWSNLICGLKKKFDIYLFMKGQQYNFRNYPSSPPPAFNDFDRGADLESITMAPNPTSFLGKDSNVVVHMHHYEEGFRKFKSCACGCLAIIHLFFAIVCIAVLIYIAMWLGRNDWQFLRGMGIGFPRDFRGVPAGMSPGISPGLQF
ncbi:hypothetical protein QYM36_017683, partial [Artemia franciscana]